MTETDEQKNKITEQEITTGCFIHRLKSMAVGDNFLKVDLYAAWLDAFDKSILDENFEPLLDECVK